MANFTIDNNKIDLESLRTHLQNNPQGVLDIKDNDMLQIRYDVATQSTEVQFKRPSPSPFLKEIAGKSLLGGVAGEVEALVSSLSETSKMKNTG
jgi:hypothetical protein